MCFEDEEDNELFLVEVPDSGSSSFDEVSEVASLAPNVSPRSDVITSGKVTGSARRLGDSLSLADLKLDLLMIFLVNC